MFKTLIKYAVVYPTVGAIGIAAVMVAVGYQPSSLPQVETVNTSEYTTSEHNIINAHEQYENAVAFGHEGYRSSYLPRDTQSRPYKGDEYRYCIDMEWFKAVDGSTDQNKHDFCAWHAEIGQWQY